MDSKQAGEELKIISALPSKIFQVVTYLPFLKWDSYIVFHGLLLALFRKTKA